MEQPCPLSEFYEWASKKSEGHASLLGPFPMDSGLQEAADG